MKTARTCPASVGQQLDEFLACVSGQASLISFASQSVLWCWNFCTVIATEPGNSSDIFLKKKDVKYIGRDFILHYDFLPVWTLGGRLGKDTFLARARCWLAS